MTMQMAQSAQALQILSPRLQQSNHILQLAAPAFQQFIQHQLRQNPFLEECEDDLIEISDFPENDNPLYPSSAAPNGNSEGFSLLPHQTTLSDYLTQELGCLHISEKSYYLALIIIEALDENGYLTQDFSTLLPSGSVPKISPLAWKKALKLIQKIAPAGIAARNLTECLLLQVEAEHSLSKKERKNIQLLISSGLSSLAEGKLAQLETTLKLSSAELRKSIAYIKTLDPKPGRQFANTPLLHSIPDVLILKKEKGWEIVPNFKVTPRIRLQSQHKEALNNASLPTSHPLQKAWQEAQWLTKCIEKRHHTICEVTKVILQKQRLFFEYSDEALRPLLISDIAKELNLHESTISRATSNKYMSTPHGVFNFRHFFSRDMAMDFGGSCSTQTIKSRIKHYISAEAPFSPLSDVALHQLLRKEDIQIAKRTVTKYRQQLHFPSSAERRQQASYRAI